MQRQDVRSSQGGFTLIEIIAVLVILGILAAVAVPKFYDLQDTAKKKNAEAAVGAGMSAISLGYAATLLGQDDAPAGPSAACAEVQLDAADDTTYTVTCDGDDWTVDSSTITGTYDTTTAEGTWTKP